MTGRIYQWPPGPHGMSDLVVPDLMTALYYYKLCVVGSRQFRILYSLFKQRINSATVYLSRGFYYVPLNGPGPLIAITRGPDSPLGLCAGFSSSVAMRLFFLLTLFYYKLIISEEWTLWGVVVEEEEAGMGTWYMAFRRSVRWCHMWSD